MGTERSGTYPNFAGGKPYARIKGNTHACSSVGNLRSVHCAVFARSHGLAIVARFWCGVRHDWSAAYVLLETSDAKRWLQSSSLTIMMWCAVVCAQCWNLA